MKKDACRNRKNPVLTIGITSYNRVVELARCLYSIQTDHPDLIEVIVSEDQSPERTCIKEVTETYARTVNHMVRIHLNPKNLGFDRNIKKIIYLARGRYVLLMSDDDYLCTGAVDRILNVLRRTAPGVLYAPFVYNNSNRCGRMYEKSFLFKNSVSYAAGHLYDSILFSGLVFQKGCVKKLDAEPFLNRNYFQVYMFRYTAVVYGGVYINIPMVQCVGDGENAYGKSDSAEKNPLLADRNSVYSNLEFHKGLIYTVRKFDEDFGTHIFRTFEREYNLRSITGLVRAEAAGKHILKKYWKKLNSLDIRITLVSKIYYYMLLVSGSGVTLRLLNIPEKLLKLFRHER